MIVVIALLLVSVFALPNYLTKKAIKDIYTIFRTHGAVTPASAMTLVKLGLQRKTFGQRLTSPQRDYKPRALDLMLQAGVIRSIAGERFYLAASDTEDQAALK